MGWDDRCCHGLVPAACGGDRLRTHAAGQDSCVVDVVPGSGRGTGSAAACHSIPGSNRPLSACD